MEERSTTVTGGWSDSVKPVHGGRGPHVKREMISALRSHLPLVLELPSLLKNCSKYTDIRSVILTMVKCPVQWR